jgi:hypothetical protein
VRHPARDHVERGQRPRLTDDARNDGCHRADQALRGRLRKRPWKLHADKAYDSKLLREGVRQRDITARISPAWCQSNERLGRHLWVIECTQAWLNRYWHLRIGYERWADIHLAFLHIVCALICWNFTNH